MTRIKQTTPNKPSYADEAFSKYGRNTSQIKQYDKKTGHRANRNREPDTRASRTDQDSLGGCSIHESK